MLANLITSDGADRVLTIDLHAGQIQGFFDIPTDNLFTAPVFTTDLQEKYKNGNLIVVSPDVGGVVRARALAKRVNADLAIIDKRRPEAGVSEVMNIIGEVDGRHCVMVDDIVDSGGTLCNAAKALMDAGALSVDAYVTHGVLSGGAVSRIASSPLSSLVTTDPFKPQKPCGSLEIYGRFRLPHCLEKQSYRSMRKNLYLAFSVSLLTHSQHRFYLIFLHVQLKEKPLNHLHP